MKNCLNKTYRDEIWMRDIERENIFIFLVLRSMSNKKYSLN